MSVARAAKVITPSHGLFGTFDSEIPVRRSTPIPLVSNAGEGNIGDTRSSLKWLVGSFLGCFPSPVALDRRELP